MKLTRGLYRYAITIAFVVLESSACVGASQLVVTGPEKLADQVLARTIVEYYQAESRKDWTATYKARGAAFQKLVPFASYKEGMNQAVADWNLIRIEILSSGKLPNDDFTVTIRFQEEFGPKAAEVYYAGVVKRGTDTTENTTVWRRMADNWFCVDAGTRRHIPLNGKMLFD